MRVPAKRVLAEADGVVDAYYPSTKAALDGLYKSWTGNPAVQKAIKALNAGDISPGEFTRTFTYAIQTVTHGANAVFYRNGVRAGEMFANLYGFNVNLNAQLWADQYAGQRIGGLRSTAVSSVNTYVTKALSNDLPLSRLKADIEHVIRMDDRFVNATINRWKASRAGSGSLSQSQRAQDAYVKRAAGIKAEMIARTETQMAMNHGKYQSLYAARAAGLLEPDDHLVWVSAPGCCETCKGLNGLTASLDDGFMATSGQAYPPLHPNCRCTFGLS